MRGRWLIASLVLAGCATEVPPTPDAAVPIDAGLTDAGPADAGVDAGTPDAGAGGCPYAGDVDIHTAGDWAAFLDAGCTSLPGTLRINSTSIAALAPATALQSLGGLEIHGNAALTTFAFPALAEIRGEASIHSNQVDVAELPGLQRAGAFSYSGTTTQLKLPALRVVEHTFSVVAPLTTLSLPSLETVDWVRLSGLDLAVLELPELRTVTRDLELRGFPRLVSVQLPELEKVAFTVVFDEMPKLETVSLGGLTKTGTFVFFNCPRVKDLIAPELASFDQLDLENRPCAIRTLSLPRLTTVGWLAMNCSVLERVDLPALKQAGTVALGGPVLAHVDLPALEELGQALSLSTGERTVRTDVSRLRSAGYLSLDDAFLEAADLRGLREVRTWTIWGTRLTALHLPALTRAFQFGIDGNPNLVDLSLPGLAEAELLSVSNNPRLTRIAAPALRAIKTSASIRDNRSLPQCEVDALKQQLTSVPATFVATGNAPCH